MRDATIKGSPRYRGRDKQWIESRIALIEQWQQGYMPKDEVQLFGSHLDAYRAILARMDSLILEAQKLVDAVKPRESAIPKAPASISPSQPRPHVPADDIRHHIVEQYFKLARARGETHVTVKSGDVRGALHMKSNANQRVCSAMKTGYLCTLGNVEVASEQGSAGANFFVRYRLLASPHIP